MPRTETCHPFYLGPLVGVRKAGVVSVHRTTARAPLGAILLSGLHQRASAECVQYRRRRSTDGIAVLAHDSDGSPPGCLIIGSTGQEVIHVYERQHAAV